MKKQFLKCENCKENLKLWGNSVGCSKCKAAGVEPHSVPLAAAILSIMAQAENDGKTLDAKSIGENGKGFLTFSFAEDQLVSLVEVTGNAIPNGQLSSAEARRHQA